MADRVPEGLSLRERKKARVRAELVEVSQRLFLEQGYDATTLEQICQEVEVAPQTLLRYFESKQQLAVAPVADGLERFRSELAEGREAGTSVLDIWRTHIVRNAGGSGGPKARRLNEMLARTPALLGASAELMQRYEFLLGSALAEEAGASLDDDLHSKLLATMLVNGNSRAFMDHLDAGPRDDVIKRLHAVVDYASEHFKR